jgi:hypothetical protein
MVAAALAVGIVAGSALAPLPYTANDECFDPADAYVPRGAEGAQYDDSLVLWPLRMRCDYDVGTDVPRSLLIGPSVAETVGWSALVALLMGAALCNRRSDLLRGAVVAACFLAPVVASLLYSDFIFACFVAMWIGVPIVIGLELALRPSGQRRWWRSVFVAIPLSAIVFVTCFFWQFLAYGRIGIAAGIAAGALAAVPLPRIWSSAARAVSQQT